MRVYLLVVLLVVAGGVQGQHKVTYLKKAHFSNGVVHQEISTLYFTPELVYEESTYLQEYFGSVLDAQAKTLSFIRFDGSTVPVDESNLMDRGKWTRTLSDTVVTILGIPCKTLVQRIEDNERKTYFSEQYTFDYSGFEFAEQYSNALDETEGAIPLGYDYTFEGVEYTLRAIDISPIGKAENKWLHSPDRHAQALAKFAKKFSNLSEKHKLKNGVSENYTFEGNIEAEGFMSVQKLEVPITLNFTAPDLCIAEVRMMGVPLWFSTGSDRGWQYLGTTDAFTVKDVRERNNFAFVVDELSFPKADTILAYHEDGINAYITFLENNAKQTAIIDLETLFLSDTYSGVEHMEIGGFEQVGDLWLPNKISMNLNEMKLGFIFKSMRITEALDESFFEIPDSLKVRLKEPSPPKKPAAKSGDYMRAEAKMQAGEYAQAVELYRKALAKEPNSALIFNQIGYCELQMEDYYGAIANFGRAIDINNQYAVAHANLAYVKDLLGDSEAAIISYSDAINISPKADYYSKRGIVKYNIDKYEEAMEDFQSAVAADSSRRDDWFNIATSLYALEAYAEAIPHFTRAIEMSPTARAYNDRGTSQYALEQYEFALNDFEQAVEMDPSSNIFRNNLGDAYGALDRHKEAIDQYLIVAENDTSNAYIYYDLGQQYMETGDTELAIEQYSRAIDLEDGEAGFYDARGAAFLKAMDYVGAIDDFSSSLTLYPDDGHIYYLRGMTKIYSSDIFDGCKDLNKAKELGSEKASELMAEKCTFSSVDGR